MTDELDLAALRRRMVAELSQDQLKAAAIDLRIDWDDLAGETRSMKALSLLDYARRDSRVPELLDWLENKRRAVAGPGDRLFVGVPTLPPHLVGRAELLNALTERLAEGEDLALVGLPGVGKTALAVALAHHPGVLARFPDGVLWASLGPQGDPLRPLHRRDRQSRRRLSVSKSADPGPGGAGVKIATGRG